MSVQLGVAGEKERNMDGYALYMYCMYSQLSVDNGNQHEQSNWVLERDYRTVL